jgi:hypothetical protein
MGKHDAKHGFRAVARFLNSLWCGGRDDVTLAGSEDSTLVDVDAVCHIKRLPNPVLGKIFAETKRVEQEVPIERVISHVAVRWRDVALGRPELWSSINARVHPEHQRELLQWYLAHADGCSLDIRITLSHENWNTDGQLLLADVLAEAPRLRGLSIRADFPNADAAVRAACKHLYAPLLEHLSFISLDQPHSFRDCSDIIYAEDFKPLIFTGGVPSLAVLRLQHLEVALYPPLRGVTTLHLEEYQCPQMAFTRFLALLRAFPALVNLSLYGDMVEKWPTAGGLYLPQLRSLRSASNGQVGRMLLALDAPALDSLVLKDVRPPTLWPGLDRVDGLRFPALRTLALDGPFQPRALAALFCEFAGVAELRLVNCDADDALELLARRGSNRLLPGLQRVMVHQVHHPSALNGVWACGITVQVHCDVPWARSGVERWTRLPHWPAELDHVDTDDLFMQLRARRTV